MGTVNLLTAADALLTLTVASLYQQPVQIQGFATDDAFNFPDVDVAETMMGVDGVLSGGWIPVSFTQEISLQADSESCSIFEQWHLNQQRARTLLIASGTAIIPSTGMQYNMVRGILKGYSPAPPVKKILQPRRFSIVWNRVTPSRYAGA